MIALVATVCALQLATPDAWATDARGRAFRVGFDPGTRLVLGVGWAWDAVDEASVATLEAAWLVRAVDDDRGVRWKLAHTIGSVAATLSDEAALEGTLYRGEYLRWSEDGAITLPTSPPTRIPFPLDIGFAVEVGRVATHPEERAWRLDVGVVQAELLFDAWRSPEVGSSLVIGVGADYDLKIDAADEVLHVVSPLSSGRLTLHHEWCQGRQLVEATIGGGSAWTSRPSPRNGARWREHARAELIWEWTWLALDDRPLALRVHADWRWDELVPERGGHEARAGIGLRLGL